MRRRRERSAAGCAAASGIETLEPRILLALNPTAQEQLMLELLNHLRADPAANLGLMTSSLGEQARSADPDIDAALRFFRTRGTTLARQWASLTSVPPLAWNEALYDAAEAHSQTMIRVDQQTHQAPGEPDLAERARIAGYRGFSSLGENVYAFAESVLHGHAGFAIDWGNDADGLQDPPGHRISMMNRAFREVGIRIIGEANPATQVGPLVITQDFGSRFNFGHSFLLGVVIADADGDRFYDPGEGLAGVTIAVSGATGTFTTTSMAAGGYQLQVPPGIYDITFSGGAFGSSVTHRNITIGADNVKLDGIRGDRPPQPEIAVLGNAVEILSGDQTPALTDGTDFGPVNLAQTRTRVFTIRNLGRVPLELAGSVRVGITGSSAFRLVGDAESMIEAGGQTSFAIEFVPQDTRPAVATVTLLSDDPDEPVYTFRLRARGQDAPDAAVFGGAGGLLIADGDSTPLLVDGTAFNTVNITGRSKTRTFVLRNTGSRVLLLTGSGGDLVQITGLHAADYSVIAPPAGALAPGEATQFRIRFNPSALGTRHATVRIPTNAPAVGVYDFAIRGSGIAAPIVQVLGNGLEIRHAAPPSALTGTQFGSTPADGGAVVRAFTIRNIGSAALLLDPVRRLRVEIGGAAPGSYRVSLQPPERLAVGQAARFRVRFDPLSRGDKFAVVSITTVNAGRFTINIVGTGV